MRGRIRPPLVSGASPGLAVLLDRPEADPARVAVIGYCFGGTIALEVARAGADIKAVVGFHPGLTLSDDSANITGSVLMCVGSDDPYIRAEARLAFEEEMRSAAVADWRVEVYGGVGHSFTNIHSASAGTPGLGYDAAADRRSWRSMPHLFEDTSVARADRTPRLGKSAVRFRRGGPVGATLPAAAR